MINAKRKELANETAFSANTWAKLRLESKAACNENWTDEEIHLYECVALGSWEHR
jgi:hypothetical protein